MCHSGPERQACPIAPTLMGIHWDLSLTWGFDMYYRICFAIGLWEFAVTVEHSNSKIIVPCANQN